MADNRNYINVCEQMKDYIKLMKDQFGPKKVEGEEGEEVEPGEVPPVGLVPDLMEDLNIYQWAGIGFGQ